MNTFYRKKSLGQCFLEDENILRLEAQLLDPTEKKVLEIGPGDGRLSQKILDLNPSELILVEKDTRFANLLKDTLPSANIIEADFLQVPIPKVDRIIGNIPYYISSEIVFRLTEFEFDFAILMVQDEFAKRMVAKTTDKNYGRLSVSSQLCFEVEYIKKVPSHLFFPKPKVNSAIIKLKPTNFKISKELEDVIRAIFQHKNKTIKNALKDSKLFTSEQIDLASKYLTRRARTMTKEECVDLTANIYKLNLYKV